MPACNLFARRTLVAGLLLTALTAAASAATTPSIAWNNPADINVGTPLSATQLNATASDPNSAMPVLGTFAYSPDFGTVLGLGLGQILSVTFTPTDTVNFTNATATVSINVTNNATTITSVSPGSGTTVGGTLVTITGTFFANGATVSFAGQPATNITVVAATQLTCYAPPTNPPATFGAVDVVVTNPDTSSATAAAAFSYVGPTITGIAPLSGPAVGGTPVIITGSGFGANASVGFGPNPAIDVSVVNETRIQCTSPSGPVGASVSVSVVNSDFTVANVPSGFTYIGGGPPVITSPSFASGVVGQPFNYTIFATNSPGAFGAFGLPAGLSLSSNGNIVGIPFVGGTYNVTLSASNAFGTGTSILMLNITSLGTPPTIFGPLSASGTVGVPFSYFITATGTPPIFYSSTSPLPIGLSISTNGNISGIPLAQGITFSGVRATNAFGTTVQFLTIVINAPAPPAPPAIISPFVASGTVGQPFSYFFQANGSQPITFGASALPPGLSITSNSNISGIPTTPGTTAVTLTASNPFGSDTKIVLITITPPTPPALVTPLNASGILNTSFNYHIPVNGTLPITFSVTGLPAGLFSSNGNVTGVPIAAGTTVASVHAVNAYGSDTQPLTITILPPAAPVIGSPLTAIGYVGTPFTYSISATGAFPITYAASPLPAGLVLSTNGNITGIPLVASVTSVTLTATNAGGSDTRTLALTINPASSPAITSPLTANGYVNSGFAYEITATGSPAIAFNATGLPAGLSLSSNGNVITGIPVATGTSPVTLKASNGLGSDTKMLALTIGPIAPPSNLFGIAVLTSNSNDFMDIDFPTAALTRLNSVGNSSVSFFTGVTAFDPTGHRFFTLRIRNSITHLVSIDPATGILTEGPSVQQSLLAMGFDTQLGKLVGVTGISSNGNAAVNYVVNIDPNTGAYTALSSVGDSTMSFPLGCNAMDSVNHRLMVARNRGAYQYVISIDTQSGTVTESGPLSSSLLALGYNQATGSLVGITTVPNNFVSIDPLTGSITPLSNIGDNSNGFLAGVRTVDNTSFYAIRLRNNVAHLIAVDTQSGTLTESPPLQRLFIALGNSVPAASTLTWTAPADIVYGTALSSTQLNADSHDVPGTFAYSPPAGTFLNAGPLQTLSVTFTPADNSLAPMTATTTINVLPATPVIVWNNPASIVYGTALDSTQLNAIVIDPVTSLPVNGTFIYSPPTNAVLNAGFGQPLSVQFMSNDSNFDPAPVDAVVSINVMPAQLLISADNLSFHYGDPVPTLTASYAGLVNGDTPASINAPPLITTAVTSTSIPGSYPIHITGLATAGSYDITYFAGTITVTNLLPVADDQTVTLNENDPGTPILLTASDFEHDPLTYQIVVYPTAGTLSGTPPNLIYTPAPNDFGTHHFQFVAYDPAGTATNQPSNNGTVTIIINHTGPVASFNINPSPAAIGSPVTFDASAASNSTGTVASFAWDFGDGTQSTVTIPQTTHSYTTSAVYTVTLTITDTLGGTATSSRTLGVYPATPIITWPKPGGIKYPTPLSATQLNATAIIPGTFVYSPPAGTVLSAGTNQPLTVTFKPTDNVTFTTATKTVLINVAQATPTISWTPPALTWPTPFGAAQENATTTAIGGGTFAYSIAEGTVIDPPNASCTATLTPNDTVDYKTNTLTKTITVNKFTPVFAWTPATPITYPAPLDGTVLNATFGGAFGGNLAGTATYSPAAGKVLAAGTHTLKVSFTPTDTAHYKSLANQSVTIVVNKGTPIVTWNDPAPIAVGTKLSKTQLNATANVPGKFVYTPALGFKYTTPGTYTLSVTFTPTDPSYNAVDAQVTIVVQ